MFILVCVVSVILPIWPLLSHFSVILTGVSQSNVFPIRDEIENFVPSLIPHLLTLVGPSTMELGRKEIQTDLSRLGECNVL